MFGVASFLRILLILFNIREKLATLSQLVPPAIQETSDSGGYTMVYFVGSFWLIAFGALGLLALLATVYFFVERRAVAAVVLGVVGLVSVYLAIFAGTHFRVPVNHRSLLIDTVNQKVIGVREEGVQQKPLIGIKVMNWPANRQYRLIADATTGTQSATTSDKIAVLVDSTMFLDLSQMDLAGAFTAVNGDWDKFEANYLIPQMLDENRRTTAKTELLTVATQKDVWTAAFDENAQRFFTDSRKGYGIELVPGQTIMSYDFVNPADAARFDDSNTSVFLQQKRENERRALLIEAEMVGIRASMVVSTTQGTIQSMESLRQYLATVPIEERQQILDYLPILTQMEYLRLVGQQEPDLIFPPAGGPAAVIDTAK